MRGQSRNPRKGNGGSECKLWPKDSLGLDCGGFECDGKGCEVYL